MNKIALLILFLFSSAVCSQQLATLHVDREWGLLLGDKIHIQAEVASKTAEIDSSSLPDAHERYGNWLFLQDIDVKENTIDFLWQIVNVPDKNKVISPPGFDIRLKDDSWIHIPPHTLIIGPALAIDKKEGAVNILPKPAHKPVLLPMQPLKDRLLIFSLITLLSGGVLFIWHIGWNPKQRSPFAQALHDFMVIKWKGRHDPEQFIRIMHTAFNRTAGTVIVPEHLEQLFEKAPWLASLQDEIRQFYQQSARHFFSRDNADSPDYKAIKKLAKACRAKEKLA